MIRAVTFDVTGTLMHCPRLGEIYAEVLGRHGHAVTAAQVRDTFPVVWAELECSTPPGRDRFTSHPGGARGWWGRLIERLCELLEVGAPSRFAVAELYGRFEAAESWEVFPDVRPALEQLSGGGLRLAVVSNFDERLPALLDALELSRWFDSVVYSAALGIAKPNPHIFEHVLGLLGVEAQRAVHVGNHVLEDAEGAAAAGMTPILVRSRGPDSLPDLLGVAREIERRAGSRRRA
jgi:putative hydrolase of the HAD superfamily